MTMFRVGPAGIPGSLKTDMNTVLNKKFGTTGQDYPPADWPADVNLMGPLPEKTVSGAIADFSDGSDDVPTKSLVVTIPASLSGVSSVTETQTGRNLADGNMTQDGANRVILIDNIYLVSSTYTISLVIASPRNFYYKKHNDVSWTNLGGYNKSVVTFSISENDYYDFSYYVSTGVLLDEISNLQLEYGSTAHAYEPYQTPTQYTASLGRTIYGGEVDIVNGEGQETHAEISDFSTLRANGTSTSGAYRYIMDVSGMGDYNVGACISNLLNYRVSWNADVGEFYNTANVLVIFLSQDNATDAINYLSSNSCKVAYPLATPTDFTFTGQEVPTRLGYNAFWSDEGDTEVTYRADINLLINNQ